MNDLTYLIILILGSIGVFAIIYVFIIASDKSYEKEVNNNIKEKIKSIYTDAHNNLLKYFNSIENGESSDTTIDFDKLVYLDRYLIDKIYNSNSLSLRSALCIRRGENDVLEKQNVILYDGELIYDKTYNKFKVGNGINKYKVLPFVGEEITEEKIKEMYADALETYRSLEYLYLEERK